MPDTDQTTEAPDAPQKVTASPKIGESTLAQVASVPGMIVPGSLGGGGVIYGAANLLYGAGTLTNPCNYPGYGDYGNGHWSWGWFGYYRWMLDHPTIRLARAIVTSPVVASPWTYEITHPEWVKEQAKAAKEKKAKSRFKPTSDEENVVAEPVSAEKPPTVFEQALELVTQVFDALRPSFIDDALRGPDYGFAPFEPIWVKDGNQTIIERLKPLLVDTTQVVTDKHGNLIALRPGMMTSMMGVGGATEVDAKTDLLVKRGKAYVYTHDGEAGNHYGRSRLENIRRTAHRDWTDATSQLQALSGKLSGRQGYAVVPAGGYTNPADNTYRTYAQDAADALTAFGHGKNPVLTSPGAAALAGGDINAWAAIAGKSFVQFDVVDFGTESQAVGGLLERIRHNEELMFQGYLMPSRAGQEGQHGTKAESETMTDTAIVNSQLLGDDIASALQPLVDMLVAVNFGLPPRSIRIKQSPLVDSRRVTYEKILTALISDPGIKQTFSRVLDMDKTIDAVDLPRDGKWDDAEQAIKEEGKAEQAEQMKQQAAAQGEQGPSMLEKLNGFVGGDDENADQEQV